MAEVFLESRALFTSTADDPWMYIRKPTAASGSRDFKQMCKSAAALNALTGAADKLPYFTNASAMALANLTTAGRALIDDADADAQRVTLGFRSARLLTQFDATTTNITNVGELFLTVGVGSYYFRAILQMTPSAGGGHKYTIDSAGVVASPFWFVVKAQNLSSGAFTPIGRKTVLGDTVGEHASGATSFETIIHGVAVVTTGGNLRVGFAQNNASGTSSVLVGSIFEVTKIA